MKARTSLQALIACTPGQLHAVQAVISYGVCRAWAARRRLSARRGAGQDPSAPAGTARHSPRFLITKALETLFLSRRLSET